MSIYDDFIGNITGKIVDDAFDGAIDKIKGQNALNKTYVWTCINKETHNGVIANLTFINKLGQRKRVPYDRLASFCESEYVSNIIFQNGKVNMIGCSINDIPDFRLNGYGGYDLKAKYDEAWVYNQALPYIQSQERLIKEDYKNKNLKSDKNTGTKSNLSSNISAVKDISTATAVTAVTAAGVAVAGGAVVAGKAIYNQINKKKVLEEQQKICENLNRFDELIKELTLIKHKTNALYSNDRTMIEYNNTIEARNDTSNKLASTINNVGVSGCIDKLTSSIEVCKSRAISNKILEIPLKLQGVKFGSIDAFINSLESKLDKVKQLHLETQQLVTNNIQYKDQLDYENNLEIQRELEQNNLVDNTKNELNNLISIIDNYKQYDINYDNIDSIEESLNNYNLNDKINNIIHNINRINDYDILKELKNKANIVKEDLVSIENNISIKRQDRNRQTINDINSELSNAEHILQSILLNNYNSGNISDGINSIINTINNCRLKVVVLSEIDKNIIENRIKTIDKNLNDNRKNIELKATSSSKEMVELENIKIGVQNYLEDAERAKTVKDLNNILDKLNKQMISKTNSFKNQNNIDEFKRIFNDTKVTIQNKINQKVEEERQLEDRKRQEIDRIVNEINDKIAFINGYNPEYVKEENLNDIVITSREEYMEQLKDYKCDFSDLSLFKSKHTELDSLVRKKRSQLNTIISNDKSAIRSLNSDRDNILIKISNINKYNKDNIKSSIERLKVAIYRDKLQKPELLNDLVTELTEKYEIALAQLEQHV